MAANQHEGSVDRPLENMTVMLIEDCPDQSRLYLKFLQQAGALVTLECNGASAVRVVGRSETEFDVIVMDFEMPEMDGLKATIELRRMDYQGPIVAITVHGDFELRDSWFHAGCNAFLAKPVPKRTLIETILSFYPPADQSPK